jgi:AraC-type transcriptional regulator N-terminus
MREISEIATPGVNSVHSLPAELARKIASLLGNEENRITEIPGVSLHRRTAPTPPCRTTYHPGIIVVAQGRKQVNLGRSSFTYDAAHYLLTAVDLPIVSWVAEASKEVPCLVLSLRLDLSMVGARLLKGEGANILFGCPFPCV